MDSSEAELTEREEDREREEVEQVVEPWEVRQLGGQIIEEGWIKKNQCLHGFKGERRLGDNGKESQRVVRKDRIMFECLMPRQN